MTPDQRYGTVSAAVLGLSAAMLVLAGLAHCAAAPTPLQSAEVTAWGADDALCDARASSRADADACHDALRKFWCGGDSGPLSPGCAHVRLSDGGVP